jgi:hypothetical protein
MINVRMNRTPDCNAAIPIGASSLAHWGPALLKNLAGKMLRFANRRRSALYLSYERVMDSMSGMPPLRILISNGPETSSGVTEAIQASFARSIHTVKIGPISPRNLACVDVVIPITVSDCLRAHQWPTLIKNNPMPIPSEEVIQLCNDKQALNERLIRNGFGSYIPTVGVDVQPPYILKKKISICGVDCSIIRNHQDEMRVLAQLSDPLFYRQQIIYGSREFATHILFSGGRIVRSLNVVYNFESDTPIKGQDPYVYRGICRCPHLDLFERILASIGFEGLCCLNYKESAGRPYLLEINPRLGSSLAPYFFSFVRHLDGSLAASRPEMPAPSLPVEVLHSEPGDSEVLLSYFAESSKV